MKLSLDAYKGKKVFITGHTGFKGFWLLSVLSHAGAVIKGYSLAPLNNESGYVAVNGDSLCESVIADIRNKERLETEVLSFAPDYIFHLAAQPLVRQSYLQPSETFEINIIGTSYVLEIARKLNSKCSIVVVTTDKVYENAESGRMFAEADRLGGHDPYSTSKACAELVVESFNKSFFINQSTQLIKVATARAGNVIGGGDFSEDRLVPDFVKAMASGKKVVLRNPLSVRPWQHVLESVIGYLKLALYLDNKKIEKSLSFNFGPEEVDHWTVRDLMETATKEWPGSSYEIKEDKALHEATLLRLNNEAAKRELAWKPIWRVQESIKQTIKWYRSSDKIAITNEQINEYLKQLI